MACAFPKQGGVCWALPWSLPQCLGGAGDPALEGWTPPRGGTHRAHATESPASPSTRAVADRAWKHAAVQLWSRSSGTQGPVLKASPVLSSLAPHSQSRPVVPVPQACTRNTAQTSHPPPPPCHGAPLCVNPEGTTGGHLLRHRWGTQGKPQQGGGRPQSQASPQPGPGPCSTRCGEPLRGPGSWAPPRCGKLEWRWQ